MFCVGLSGIILGTGLIDPVGTVGVPEGEQRDGPVRVTGGTVVIAGQVNGDLIAYGGRVIITDTASVTGDVRSFGGVVRIAGRVAGATTAYGGRVSISGETGSVNAGGIRVVIGGRTASATVLGSQLVLLGSAEIRGDLEYDAQLIDRGGSVAGTRVSTDRLLGPIGPVIRGLRWLLVAGPLLAGVFGIVIARFADRDVLSDAIFESPVRSLLGGTVVALAVSAVLVIVPFTLVALPLIGLWIPIICTLVLIQLAFGQRAIGIGITRRTAVSCDTGALGIAMITSMLAIPFPGVAATVIVFLTLLGGGGTLYAMTGDDRVFT